MARKDLFLVNFCGSKVAHVMLSRFSFPPYDLFIFSDQLYQKAMRDVLCKHRVIIRWHKKLRWNDKEMKHSKGFRARKIALATLLHHHQIRNRTNVKREWKKNFRSMLIRSNWKSRSKYENEPKTSYHLLTS